MADQAALIARKQEVRRRIEQLRRRLERERLKSPPIKGQIRKVENELERWMAEEYNLRVAIDRTR